MPSASAVKFNAFSEHVAEKVHNLGADALKIYLSNTAPNVATHSLKGDLAEISTGNGYAAAVALTITSSAQSGGVYKLVADDITITASGGSIGPFRYAVLYNDTPASPLDPLIQYWDYGSAITLGDGEPFTLDLSQTNGVLTIT